MKKRQKKLSHHMWH